MMWSSGIGSYIRYLVPKVIQSMPEAQFYLLGRRQEMERWAEFASGPRIEWIEITAPILSIAEQFELAKKIPKDTDLFWSPNYNFPIFWRGKLMTTVHDVFHLILWDGIGSLLKRFYAYVMFNRLVNRADALLSVSEFTKGEIVRRTGASPEKIRVIHNGVDDSWFGLRKNKNPHPRPYILFVGNIKPHKNLARLLEAFSILKDRIPHDLVLVGKKEGFITGDRRVLKMAESIGDRVRFTGFVDDALLGQYYALTDLLVFPSIYEGFGLPPLEAMACGRPVAVSNAASIPEVCGDAAVYFDPYSSKDIAEKISKVLEDEPLRNGFIQKGLERARLFTWERCVSETVEVIQRLLNGEFVSGSSNAGKGFGKWWESDFLRKVAAVSANRGFVMGMGFLISILLVRVLGPEGRGLYVSALSVALIGVQLGNLGLQVPHTLLVTTNKGSLAGLTANSLVAGLLIGGTGAGLAWIFFLFFPSFAPVHGWLLGMSLLWIPFGIIYYLFYNLLIGIQNVRGHVKIDSTVKAVQLLVVLLLAVFLPSPVEIFFACALILLVLGCCWQFLELRKHFEELLTPSADLYKNNFYQGLKVYLMGIFSLFLVRVDVLIVKYILGSEQTGYYSIAASMADVIPLIPGMIGVILFPKLSSLRNTAERWKLARRTIWTTSLFLLPWMTLAYFLAGPVIKLVYGTRFLPAVGPFQLLIPGIYFLAIQMVAVQFLKSEKFPLGVLFCWGGTVALNIFMNFWLLPRYGIEGASVISSACYFLIFLLTLLVIRNRVPDFDKEAIQTS